MSGDFAFIGITKNDDKSKTKNKCYNKRYQLENWRLRFLQKSEETWEISRPQ